jgi:hypothetical protein
MKYQGTTVLVARCPVPMRSDWIVPAPDFSPGSGFQPAYASVSQTYGFSPGGISIGTKLSPDFSTEPGKQMFAIVQGIQVD